MRSSKLIEPGKWYVEYDENGNRTAYVYEDSAIQLLGYSSREDYINALGAWDNAVHPDDMEALNEYIADLESKHPEGMDYDAEYRIMTKRGYRWIHDCGHATRREDGSLIRVDGAAFDIQDILEKEDTAKQLEESLAFTNFFLDTYVSAYFVDLDTCACQVYLRTEELEKNYPVIDNYLDGLTEYINKDVHPDDRAELLRILSPDNLKRRLKDASDFTHIFRDISDNNEKYYRVQVIRGVDEHYAALGFIDVTEEYREQQSRLLGAIPLSSDVLIKANIGLWSFELDEGCEPRMYADEAMLGLIGLDHQISPEETYHAWYDNIDDGSYDLVADAVAKMTSGEHAEVQYPWHNPNGEIWTVRCGGVRNFAYTKGIRIEGTHQNVTKMAHFQKRGLADMLAALSDDFLSIYFLDPYTGSFEAITTGSSYDADDDRDFSKVNFYEDVADRSGGIVHPDDKPLIDKMYDQQNLISVLESGKPAEFIVRWPTGQEDQCVYMKNKLVPYIEDDGTKKLIIGVLDVTNEKLKEKQIQDQQVNLEKALEMAESANRAKSAFLFNMSHDIRTPMNAIIGFNNMAISHLDDTDRVKDCLDKVNVSSKHLLSLINDVLDMARIESGKEKSELEPACVTKAASELIDMVRQTTLKDLDFETDFSAVEHDYVLADALHINRIITNIISNSVKYTEAGGKIKYTIVETEACYSECNSYDFIIEDTGIGMSEEFLEHIFDEFSREQTSTMSGVGGTGLGMAITKNLVDLLGGTIAVESEQGRGTKVTVHLNMKAIDEQSLEKPDETDLDVSLLAGKRVLLVEDNELNREIATDIFEEYGMVVECAENGEIAVTKCHDAIASGRENYHDIILMDIQMPVMDGYEATRIIRSFMREGVRRIPIIAMTANAFDEDRKKALDCGMNAHLSKPIDRAELEKTLLKWI